MLDDLQQRLAAALAPRYTVEHEHGRGGMAIVYRCHDNELNRTVAVKVLRSDLASALASERFVREIGIVSKLHHPHVLGLFDAQQHGGLLYYFMPYATGGTLRDRIHHHKQLGLDDVVQITREVADALDYAHRHHVVHRDIKPENILFDDRHDGHALVGDFGVARAVVSSSPGGTLTEVGTTVGTIHYMSPEQAAGEPHVDGRADVYALGCVVYEMIAGVPPFQGVTAESVLRQHQVEIPRPLGTHRSGLPAGLDAVVQKALAKAPADRWQHAGDFANALAAAVERRSAPRPGLRMPLAVAGGAAAIAIAYVLWRVLFVPPPGWNRVAVLCFDNLSSDTADQYLADGLTEEMTARLGQIDKLDVQSRAAALRFCGKPNRDPVSVGGQLHVASVVTGTVQREGRRLRVSVELARTTDGDRLWGGEFDRQDSSFMDIQEDIATAVGNTIAGRLDTKSRNALTARPTRNPEAYDQYLRGNRYLAQRTARSVARAIAEYQQATRHDPRFASALGRMAYGYALFVYYGWPYRDLSADSVLELGFASADSALHVDSTAAEAWLARGRFLEVRNPHRYEGVLGAYERAATLDPKNAEVRNMIGTTLRELGDDSGATRAFHAALELDPDRATTLNLLSIQAAMHRRFAEAAQWADSALTVDPGFYDALVTHGFNRVLTGDTAGARSDAVVAAGLRSGDHFSDQILLVIVDARAGRRQIAERRLAQLARGLDWRTPGPLPGALLAWAYFAVGQREQGLTLLERVQPRGASLWFWLQSPGFDSVRSNPRFRRIVQDSQSL